METTEANLQREMYIVFQKGERRPIIELNQGCVYSKTSSNLQPINRFTSTPTNSSEESD